MSTPVNPTNKLYLYKLTRGSPGAVVYASCIVVASNKETAQKTGPHGCQYYDGKWYCCDDGWGSKPWECDQHDYWPIDPEQVNVEELGIVTNPTLREFDVF
jgi:hypothetical protein